MKLFEVTNGWYGNSYVRCLVIAQTEELALKYALERYRKESVVRQYRPTQQSWLDLKAELLCDDCAVPWAGEVTSE